MAEPDSGMVSMARLLDAACCTNTDSTSVFLATAPQAVHQTLFLPSSLVRITPP